MSTKPKILITGPFFNVSGYSNHSRVLLESFVELEDKYDIYIDPTQWAASSVRNEFYQKYKRLVDKKNNLLSTRAQPDGQVNIAGLFKATFQVCPPNEFRQLSEFDVGVTAGLETDSAPSEWVSKCNQMKEIFIISNHSKKSLLKAVGPNGEKISTKISVLPPAYIKQMPDCLESKFYDKDNIKTNFNFLCVAQFAPRKNLENMLAWFVEEFHDESDVGLFFKTHYHNSSVMDFYACKRMCQKILARWKDRKCKIHIIHGNLNDEEMSCLYDKENIDCYVTAAHGEGFGIPLLSAASNGIPIVATNWSGYLDFLRAPHKKKTNKIELKSHFIKVNYDIKKVEQRHLMPGLITPDCEWAYPQEKSFKKAIRSIRNNKDLFLKDSQALKEFVNDKYSKSSVIKNYKDNILRCLSNIVDEEDEIQKMFASMMEDKK
tara:strand:+ start:918 stop:2216 length:1299 start_codon:yes stop_codon:yes gene_type:complete